MECTLYLTETCNLKCSYCYEGLDKEKTSLSSEQLPQIIKFIVENNPEGEDINLIFLGGEPLLNKKLIYEFINIVDLKYEEVKHIFKYSITTNGILLDKDLIDVFKKNNFDVSISIDGDKHTHNLNRVSINGKDVYETILDNMKLMMNLGLNASVRMTVTLNNVKFLYSNVRYFNDMGVKKINIGIDNMGEWQEDSLQELEEQYSLLDKFYLDVISENEGSILNLYDFKLSTFVAEQTPAYCSGGSQGHLVISSKGELYPCGYVVNDTVWNLGNVNTGLDRGKFITSVRANVEGKSKCHKCDIAFTCSGAKCGFYNYMKTGKLNSHTSMTCDLERLLHKHNLAVITELYKKNHARLFYYLKIAVEKGIQLSSTMTHIIESLDENEIR